MSESGKKKIALKVDDADNVATIFAEDVTDGSEIILRDKKGNEEVLTVKGDIPYGHKIAVETIASGAHIMKYGQSIGAADREIARGEYVHIHNMKALRGRGDLAAASST